MITYRYANNDNEEYVDINDVDVVYRNNHKFFCISCNSEMVASLGNKNTHHFRHKQDTYSCNKETYLHKLGKFIFREVYQDCLKNNKPYNITMFRTIRCSRMSTCNVSKLYEGYGCTEYKKETYDLTQYYNVIEEEKKIDSHIPDLLLKGSDNRKPIFIEIKVTHSCTDDKIKLGYPIIEIPLKDESDLDLIKSRDLVDYQKHGLRDTYREICERDNTDKDVAFYNFKHDIYKPLAQHDMAMFFVKKKTLACYFKEHAIKCNKIEETIRKKNYAFEYRIIFYYFCGIKSYLFGLAKACEKGIEVRNCYLCKYHTINKYRYPPDHEKPLKCEYYSEPYKGYLCDPKDAKECKVFSPDQSIIERYLSYESYYEEF